MSRNVRRYPEAQVVGVDILAASIEHARHEHASLSPRLRFEVGDAFDLTFASDMFDLVVCRHRTQAVPQPELRELGLEALRVDYAVVDSLRVPRDVRSFYVYASSQPSKSKPLTTRAGTGF